MEYILVFDAGTGSVRAVLFDTAGMQVASSQVEWTHLEDLRFPGSMDFDVSKNWGIIQTCISQVLAQSGIDPKDIKAISATSMREGFVLYDANGREIWACANVDARAMEEAKELKNTDTDIEKKMNYQVKRLLWALFPVSFG
jgi:autoinducer 2 (AI-2) kinase